MKGTELNTLPSPREKGYILLEASVALVLLTLGVFVVQGSIREAIVTRGQAQDFTQAKFLLEQIMGDIESQPQLTEHSKAGGFPGHLNRFTWRYDVQRVDLPAPPPPAANSNPGVRQNLPIEYLAHVIVVIEWERSGRHFERSIETLLSKDKLWQPPKQSRSPQRPQI